MTSSGSRFVEGIALVPPDDRKCISGNSPLRYSFGHLTPSAWARQAAKYRGDPAIAPIYAWETIAQRLEPLSAMGRDHRVTFYRHGMTKYNERRRLSGLHNTVLTDAGRDQAKQISGLLAPRLNVVCCSALVRAIETMELALGLRRLHNTPIFIDPRLNEVCAGRYQGRSHRAVGAGRDRNIDGAPEGGESYRQAAARIFSFLIDLADQVLSCQTEQTRSAVFCHAGVLRIVLTLVHSPTRPAEMFEWRFENARGFEIELADVRLPGFWTNGNG